MRVTGSSLLSDKVAERSAIASSSTWGLKTEQIPCGWATSQNGIIFPTTMSIPIKNGPFWGALGVPPFKETPIFETTTVTVVFVLAISQNCLSSFLQFSLRIEQMETGWVTFMRLHCGSKVFRVYTFGSSTFATVQQKKMKHPLKPSALQKRFESQQCWSTKNWGFGTRLQISQKGVDRWVLERIQPRYLKGSLENDDRSSNWTGEVWTTKIG